MCRQTRQVVAYFVGDRSAQSARALCERIPPEYRLPGGRAMTPGWRTTGCSPQHTHCCPGKGVDQTCYVESWNHALCQRLGRFVRRVLSFTKCERIAHLVNKSGRGQ